MSDEIFDRIEKASSESKGADEVLELLCSCFCEKGQYAQLFEALLMKKRAGLGLPLIESAELGELDETRRKEYEDGYIDAARVVGGKFLDDGNIVAAWPYYRAINEPELVAEALNDVEPEEESVEELIGIAFYEQANPARGFQFVLDYHGTCNAITSFEQYGAGKDRPAIVHLLVRHLHGELLSNLKASISEVDGQEPEGDSITELLVSKSIELGQYDYHIDPSHLHSTVRFSLEATDPEVIQLAIELTEYGKRLSSDLQYSGNPPFENTYVDNGFYLRALVGQQVDEAIGHFRRKIKQDSSSGPGEGDDGFGDDFAPSTTLSAQVLVALLAKVGRIAEAIEVFVEYLREPSEGPLVCPSLPQLCHEARDYDRLQQIARSQGDLVTFAAAVLSRTD